MHRPPEMNPGQAAEEAQDFFGGHYKAMFLENVDFLKARAD